MRWNFKIVFARDLFVDVLQRKDLAHSLVSNADGPAECGVTMPPPNHKPPRPTGTYPWLPSRSRPICFGADFSAPLACPAGTVADLFATTQEMTVYLTRLLEYDDMSPC